MLYWRTIETRLLLPSFVEDLNELFSSDPADWYVICGFRSIAESDRLYKIYQDGGPKAAPGGKSPHNFGLAIDFVLDGDIENPRLQPEWNERHPDWIRIRGAVDAHPRLHGGWWFGDGDHIERTKWHDFKEWSLR